MRNHHKFLLPFLSLCAIICTTHLRAQNIEAYTLEIDFAPYNTIHSTDYERNLDYLNSIDEYDSVFFDDATVNLSSHLWFNNKFELDIEFGLQADLVPRHFDFRGTFQRALFDIHVGFSNKVFFLYDIEKGFDHNFKVTYADQDWYQWYFTSYGPYVGIRKLYDGDRINISANLNAGIYFNNSPDLECIILKERTSNLIIKEIHHLKTRPSIWLQPEAIAQFDIIKTEHFDFGLCLEINYYITQQKLNYDVEHYEWTANNKTEYSADVSKHLIQRFDLAFGIYLKHKKSQL